jgi:hypothetical protein
MQNREDDHQLVIIIDVVENAIPSDSDAISRASIASEFLGAMRTWLFL